MKKFFEPPSRTGFTAKVCHDPLGRGAPWSDRHFPRGRVGPRPATPPRRLRLTTVLAFAAALVLVPVSFAVLRWWMLQ